MLSANSNASSWLWSTGETSSSILVSTGGIFSVTVSNSYCSRSDTIQVTAYPLPHLNLGNDTAICSGQTLQLDAGNAGSIFEWSTGESSQQIVVTQSPVEISVVVTNHNCKSSDTINIANNCGVIVPNAFTPNGDGLNDVFMPILNGVNDFELRIFNRYGEIIFMTTDPDTGWDGSYMGKAEEIGTYVYVIKSQTISGDPEIYKGNLTLLR